MNIFNYFQNRYATRAGRRLSGNLINLSQLHFAGVNCINVASLVLLLLALAFNWWSGNYAMLPPLTLIILLVAGGALLHYFKPDSKIPLFISGTPFVLLFFYLVFVQGAFNNNSLLWLMFAPPMLLFCMGLRWGTVVFAASYLFLLLIFWIPLESAPPFQYDAFRVCMAILGTFCFSWVVEYTRSRSRNLLANTVNSLEHAAGIDYSTGLGNRREFNNYFNWLQSQSQRSNRPFSIVMADIDLFKRVNDNYGHLMGDQVLRHVANLFSCNLRASDRVFRWGGEEFIVLMPFSNIYDATVMAERIRKLVEESPYIDNTIKVPITISLGAYCGGLNESLDEQINQVDSRLYKAKVSGRNQVCFKLN